jgi:tripartite-type tricarboxylate transporter receptor subunit TctC
VRTRLVNDASTPVGNTPQEFASYLKSEIEKWSKVVRLSGAQAD